MTNSAHKDSLEVRLAAGRPAFGAWMFFQEPGIAASASKLGFDFVVIDMQHGVAGFDATCRMIDAVRLGRAAAVVRLPGLDAGLAGRCLDAGAVGLIFPMINSRAEAEAAVRACKYPPHGLRSMGAIGATLHYGDDYFDHGNGLSAVIPMIETREAVANLDDILSVEGIDMVLVGPSDLAISYGQTPMSDNPDPEVQATLAHVAARCAAHGMVAGIYASAGLAAKRLAQGYRLVSIGTDWDAAIGGLAGDLAVVRSGA